MNNLPAAGLDFRGVVSLIEVGACSADAPEADEVGLADALELEVAGALELGAAGEVELVVDEPDEPHAATTVANAAPAAATANPL
jgi:hypothetical protein